VKASVGHAFSSDDVMGAVMTEGLYDVIGAVMTGGLYDVMGAVMTVMAGGLYDVKGAAGFSQVKVFRRASRAQMSSQIFRIFEDFSAFSRFFQNCEFYFPKNLQKIINIIYFRKNKKNVEQSEI
jgi:hypothetical protein